MKQSPLYEQIYEEMKEAIRSGAFKPGDKLPSEKELSERYSVSRITSKKALEMLAEEGQIIRMAGKGSFVAENTEGAAKKFFSGGGSLASDGEERTKLVGVIMEGFGPSFGMVLLTSLEYECKRHHFAMVLKCSYGSVEEEAKAIEELKSLGVEGMVIMCAQDENYNPKILQLVVEQFPIVTVDRQLKGIPVPYIGTDNMSAARELTRCLLFDGYRKICFAKPDAAETSSLKERQAGYVMAMNESGLLVDENDWILKLRATLPSQHSDEMVEKDMERVTEYLEEHPDIDAFLAAEYSIARIIYRCLKDRELHHKYPVVCFDSSDNILNEYRFTHVKQNENEIGRLAIQALYDVMNGKTEACNILAPYQIIEATYQEL